MIESTAHSNHILSPPACDIIRTLIYFDIFHYPLTKEEIMTFSPSKKLWKIHNIDELLGELVIENVLYQTDSFYSLHDVPALAERRRNGNELASLKLKTAYKISTFISWFPFVRAIMLSGSISKGYMDEKSDIDFFIVTAPNRLWIARTLLVLFKRVFLFNSHKNFCVNYFIDSENLEIEEKNLFTAMESITLIPTYGKHYYENFWNDNAWTASFFPNAVTRCTEKINDSKDSLIKQGMERLLNNRFGNWIDRYFMWLTQKRWQNKFRKDFTAHDFEVAFKSKKYASKNHPRFYQKKILNVYSEKIKGFEEVFNVRLNDKVA